MKKPNLFIVGLDRSGTTALYRFLSQHPEICMSKRKEPHFFSKDLQEEAKKFHNGKRKYGCSNLKEYLDYFACSPREKILGDSSTSYLISKIAAKEIHKFNPNAKIIIILREPVSYIYSSFSRRLSNGIENIRSFRKVLELGEERRKGKLIPKHFEFPSSGIYLDKTKFYDQVKRYFSVFRKSQIKIIIYEDFKKDNLKTYKEILKFLNVDSNFVPNFFRINENVNARFGSRTNAFFRGAGTRKIIKTFVSEKIYDKHKDFFKKKVLLKKGYKQSIDPKLKKELKIQLKPEVKKISKFLKINFVKKWGYDEI